MRDSEFSGSQSRSCVASSLWRRTLVSSLILDLAEHFGHAVDERLNADEAGLGMSRGLSGKVFTATEANLQEDGINWLGKEVN